MTATADPVAFRQVPAAEPAARIAGLRPVAAKAQAAVLPRGPGMNAHARPAFGTLISAFLHLGMLGWLAFGMAFGSATDGDTEVETSIALIDTAEFDALSAAWSAAPAPVVTAPEIDTAPPIGSLDAPPADAPPDPAAEFAPHPAAAPLAATAPPDASAPGIDTRPADPVLDAPLADASLPEPGPVRDRSPISEPHTLATAVSRPATPVLPPPLLRPRSDRAPDAVQAPAPARSARRAAAPAPRAQSAPSALAQTRAPDASAPVGGTSSSALSDGKRQKLMARWAGQIRARIDRRKSYPAEASARGETGTVTLLLNVAADGSLQSFDVARSSGHAALDQAALAAARSAGPFPTAPAELAATAGSFAFSLPVTFGP